MLGPQDKQHAGEKTDWGADLKPDTEEEEPQESVAHKSLDAGEEILGETSLA